MKLDDVSKTAINMMCFFLLQVLEDYKIRKGVLEFSDASMVLLSDEVQKFIITLQQHLHDDIINEVGEMLVQEMVRGFYFEPNELEIKRFKKRISDYVYRVSLQRERNTLMKFFNACLQEAQKRMLSP